MDRLKQWLGLSLLALLALLAGGWFLLIAPERSAAADLRLQAESEQLTNAQLETQLEVLRQKAAELPAKRAELAEVAAKVPDSPSLPDLVRALSAAARDAGVVLTSVTPGTPVPLSPPVPAAAPVEGAAAPVEGAAAPAVPADPAAAAGGSGLSELPVVLDVAGNFYEIEQFLVLLEDLPRAMRVTSLLVQAEDGGAAAKGRTLRSTVTASAYVRAATPAAPAAPAAAPGAPAVPAAPAAPSTGTAR